MMSGNADIEDANENAIKIARMYTGRNKIFSRYRSYHGSSFEAGNLTGEPRRYPLEPGIHGFVKFFDPYIYRDPVHFASIALNKKRMCVKYGSFLYAGICIYWRRLYPYI